MEIKGIGNTNLVPMQEVKKAQTPPVEVEKRQDSVEISSQAKVLQLQSEKTRDLTEIQQKVENGFYNSDDVIKATVTSLMKEFNFS